MAIAIPLASLMTVVARPVRSDRDVRPRTVAPATLQPGPDDAAAMVAAARRTGRMIRREVGDCRHRRACVWVALGRAQMGGTTLARFSGRLAQASDRGCRATLQRIAAAGGILSEAAAGARARGQGAQTVLMARHVAVTAHQVELAADGAAERAAARACTPGSDGPSG